MSQGRLLRNVAFKALILFILFNGLYVILQPLPLLDHVTLYNRLFPGRERFPWSEHPDQSFSVSVTRIDALFASHRLAGTPKVPDEYRVLFLGDSSIWGLEVAADETTPACLDRLKLPMGKTGDKVIRAYNLAYPAPNALRDMLILNRALTYQPDLQPDLIVWPLTLRSLNRREFPLSDVVLAQANEANALAAAMGFTLPLPAPNWADRTFFAQRSALAAWWQHQLQGFAWRATGVDYAPREFSAPPQFDLSADTGYDMSAQAVAREVIPFGMALAAAHNVPLLLINEPIYISSGANSNQRYNADYPRWAYDQYRAELTALTQKERWPYLDLWDAVPPEQFVRTALHYTPEAACTVAARIGASIQALAAQP